MLYKLSILTPEALNLACLISLFILCFLVEIQIHTITMGLSIIYSKGSQVGISISFPNDCLHGLSKYLFTGFQHVNG